MTDSINVLYFRLKTVCTISILYGLLLKQNYFNKSVIIVVIKVLFVFVKHNATLKVKVEALGECPEVVGFGHIIVIILVKVLYVDCPCTCS